MALYDRDEHLLLEGMMSKLGLEDGNQDAESWEVEEEWLVTWLEVEDRLGLGPDELGDGRVGDEPGRDGVHGVGEGGQPIHGVAGGRVDRDERGQEHH